jgi:hypothetical protein
MRGPGTPIWAHYIQTLPTARAVFAKSSSSVLFDLAWLDFADNGSKNFRPPKGRAGVASVTAMVLAMDILRPLSTQERVIKIAAPNVISITPTEFLNDGVTHRYRVEKCGGDWVIVGMPTLGDDEVAQAKQANRQE